MVNIVCGVMVFDLLKRTAIEMVDMVGMGCINKKKKLLQLTVYNAYRGLFP